METPTRPDRPTGAQLRRGLPFLLVAVGVILVVGWALGVWSVGWPFI